MKAVKAFLKKNKAKLIGYPIAIVVIGVLVFLVIHFGKKSSTSEAEEIVPYQNEYEENMAPEFLDNGIIRLEFDPNTTHFTLTDKYGNTWYSTSQTEDLTHSELEALIQVVWQNSIGTRYEYDSNSQSVERHNYNYSIDKDNNKLTINYTIGKIERTYYFPEAITEERYKEITGAFQSENAKQNKSDMLNSYIKLTWEKVNTKENKKYLEKYPKIEEDLKNGMVLYLVRDGMQPWKKEHLQTILEEEIGYDKEAWLADQEAYTETAAGVSLPAVNVTLELQLDGEDLVVTVPYDKIQFKSSYPLTEIRILPFMLSEPTTSEGFLFIPDGSGSITYFNNGKSQQEYSAKIYGTDYCMTQEEYVSDPLVNFPVYGISVSSRTVDGQKQTTNQSMLAMVEEGESYGVIKANVPGSGLNVNYVSNMFNVVHNEEVNVGNRSTGKIYAYEKDFATDESISIRYRAVNSTNYVDMAKTYRDYYINRYPELNTPVSGEMPVAVELVGAINKVQHILGFPKDRPFALTTYSQMADIVKDLNDNGMTNLSVVFEGWFNDGVRHDVPDDISFIRVLGGKSAFKKAVKSIEDANNVIYLKAGFTYVYDNGWFDSFSYRRDTAKFLSREFAKLQDFSKVWYGIDDEDDFYYYLANPAYVEKTMRGYLEEIQDLGMKNIAYTDIGNSLSADYNRKKAVTREKAKDGQVTVLNEVVASGSKIVMYDPYEYAIPKASLILDMDVDSTHSCLTDEAIPFFPIVLHGLVDYTGDALNVTADFTNNLLNCAETGAGLYFTFMHNEGMDLAESDYTYLFGANYESWKADALKYYERFKKDFTGTYGATIEDHEIIESGIRKTTFSNGTVVYVNYRTAEYTTADGITIPAQDWVVKGGN
ncbi:MAG: hypothetical protein J6Y67_00830 [Lachnospiraceae bacterium]|nr:hypothetical protein [Lachnospiraceae bacterium]